MGRIKSAMDGCVQGLPHRLPAASAFRVRGTHFISCSFEDAIRRVEVLGLPCLMQHWGDKEVGVRIWVSGQGFGSCLLNRVL